MSIVIKPQKGPQEKFLASAADIVIYGGAAGSGKSYALLLHPLRHVENAKFTCLLLRKNSNQIFSQGGLWDTSMELYPVVGAYSRKTPKAKWIFPSGMNIAFDHLQNASDVLKFQGSQIAMIGFDELTHFGKSEFFYMLSRNRSMSGVNGQIVATCNPDADSWVADFISWWVDQDTGYPIPERSGVIRWMYRLNDAIYWADTQEELWERFNLVTKAERAKPKSVTFISAKLSDNKILMEKDPGYLANLEALATVERERLLHGNWKIKPMAGMYFKRSRVVMLEELPNDIVKIVRAWDMAATEDKKTNNPEDGPAFTAGVLMGKRKNGRFVVIDVINQRLNAADVQNTILNTAKADKAKYKRVKIRLNQDPGQAGKAQAEQYMKLLAGFSVNIERESGSKETRAEPLSAQWLGVSGSAIGNVDVMIADWNDAYFSQLESFPEGKFKDMVDASSTAFDELTRGVTSFGLGRGSADADRESPWKF